MTMGIPQIGTVEGPRYLAVVSAIVKAIDSGQLPSGARLPPRRELADRLRLTVGTISRAQAALAHLSQLGTNTVAKWLIVRGTVLKVSTTRWWVSPSFLEPAWR